MFNPKVVSLTLIAQTIYDAFNLPYHNTRHIRNMMGTSWEICKAYGVEPSHDLMLAVWYHDVVYIPGNSDNEKCSAELFKKMSDSIKCLEPVLDYDVDRVTQLIMLTSKHLEVLNLDGMAIESKIILDADLAGFANPDNDAYHEVSATVMAEFKHVPKKQLLESRIKFLETMLAKPNIYYTEYAREKFEKQARYNIDVERIGLEMELADMD